LISKKEIKDGDEGGGRRRRERRADVEKGRIGSESGKNRRRSNWKIQIGKKMEEVETGIGGRERGE
jgi:hypothetical protein